MRLNVVIKLLFLIGIISTVKCVERFIVSGLPSALMHAVIRSFYDNIFIVLILEDIILRNNLIR